MEDQRQPRLTVLKRHITKCARQMQTRIDAPIMIHHMHTSCAQHSPPRRNGCARDVCMMVY
eukprot:1159095-Pelagomonas_calceolata.AAC.4